jgi:hypothetical protein
MYLRGRIGKNVSNVVFAKKVEVIISELVISEDQILSF